MRNLILSMMVMAVFALFSFATVNDANATIASQDEMIGQPKVDVCHYSEEDDQWVLINVSVKSVPAHRAHGDAVDMDGDGYFDAASGCGDIIDCDDEDPDVFEGC